MKKNAMLKIAAVLLVAVLLTTCAISSTFAKYATDGGHYNEEARVAKWGVVVSNKLDTSEAGFSASYGSSNDKKVTSDDNTTKVVAPGTTGVMTVKFAVTGTPEVSGRVIVSSDADSEQDDYLVVGNGLVDEIKWTLTDGSTVITGIGQDTIDDINEYFFGWNNPFTPNNFTAINKNITLEWEWAFDDTTDDSNADEDDTKLGNAAAGIGGEAQWIRFNIYADIVQTGPTADSALNY